MKNIIPRLTFYIGRFAFAALARSLQHEKNPEKQAYKAKQLLNYAKQEGFGHFSCSALENYYGKIGSMNPVPLAEALPETCLIVFTLSYFTGGHTRVAERWIETDTHHRYSVAFTAPQNGLEIPERLKNAVAQSGGELLFVNGENALETGLNLRRIASKFESVVLFTHMGDPTAIIAFASSDFKRPVGFYNHADHRFWLGVSISDIIGELH